MKLIVTENIYKVLIGEENHELEEKNSTYQIPKEILTNLTSLYNKVKDDEKYTRLEGYKRLQNIITSNGMLSYDWLRRIKNFFDHYNGGKNIIYMLNGGDELRLWVNDKLRQMTNTVADSQELQKDMGITHIKYSNNLPQNLNNTENFSISYK